MDAITDTFVLVAPDCPETVAVAPTAKGDRPTVAVVQYELLTTRPYQLTLHDLIFETHVRRAGLTPREAVEQAAQIRAGLFSRPQACMRASPLPKRYGWGVHYDGQGRLALFAVESEEYRRFASAEVSGIKLVPAMRSKRAS